MLTIKEQLRALSPEKGLIGYRNYELAMIKLRQFKSELMDALVKNDKDKEIFLKYWPFDCRECLAHVISLASTQDCDCLRTAYPHDGCEEFFPIARPNTK
ncbi:predicted protein [Histoplasma capsulatum G186AR]|uniref:Uncharacterized protein n=2 Tax=Ajellomyces capsulatus TaxID=5037 RepID=C0NI08_AJECG|nr:uncharacterized protein HCBG_02980 [Histoplasma capsulatum G186AR]EEH09443.1 predicted protein [Histoplasma capsulatum G186AR]KAG5303222.1 hypothetical protein I7I52_01152 [Histoplasma capsulatum]QSS68820.1 hypothetical protein I7I50_09914 [Histoplasma capsulatum G186AR]